MEPEKLAFLPSGQGGYTYTMKPAARILPALLGLFAAAGAQIPTGVKFTAWAHTDGVNKFTWPVAMEEIPGADDHFLVLEKNGGGSADSGRVWMLSPGAGLTHIKRRFHAVKVFSENVSNAELGLLGLAFHPKFRENRKYYLDYNPDARTHAVEERTFTADFSADAGTSRMILTLPANSGHNGGSLAFGPDGFLYVTTGDAVNPPNGQSRATLHGKVLRLDVDNPSGGRAYGIPADNPFQEAGQKGEIFAFGLRNPWKLSFDPLDGRLYVGDVGAAAFEEVNLVARGGNYGWTAFEGTSGGGGPCATECLAPKTLYGRSLGRSIVGGHVYRGDPQSRFYGVYIFGDYNYNGPVFGWKVDGASGSQVQIGEVGRALSGMARDRRNNLYAIAHDNGAIYRLDHAELKAVPTPVKLWKGMPSRVRVDLQNGRLVWTSPAGGKRVILPSGRHIPL